MQHSDRHSDEQWTPVAPGVNIGWIYSDRSEFPGVLVMVADGRTMPKGYPMLGMVLEGRDTGGEWHGCILTVEQARTMARLLEREAKKAERIAGRQRRN